MEEEEWQKTQLILQIQQALRTANMNPQQKAKIERNLEDYSLEELENLLPWLYRNQISLVHEGKAKQKEITAHIKKICGL